MSNFTVKHSCPLGDFNILLLSQAKLMSYSQKEQENQSTDQILDLQLTCLMDAVRDEHGNPVFTDKEALKHDYPARYLGELYIDVFRLNAPDYTKKN